MGGNPQNQQCEPPRPGNGWKHHPGLLRTHHVDQLMVQNPKLQPES
jgi:hypothetical protein